MLIRDKGNFKKSDGKIVERCQALHELTFEVQQLLGAAGPQTTWQSARDFIFAHDVGIEYVNVEKHGYDIAIGTVQNEVLHLERQDETKYGESATFNDTTLEKVDEYAQSNGFLWVVNWREGNWDYAYQLPLNNCNLIAYLREKILSKKPESRSSQTIGKKQLLDWGAKKFTNPNYRSDE